MLQVHKNLVNICYIILSEAAISIKISNLLICFCSFDVFCPILEKDNSYIVLVLFNSILYYNLFCFYRVITEEP